MAMPGKHALCWGTPALILGAQNTVSPCIRDAGKIGICLGSVLPW